MIISHVPDVSFVKHLVVSNSNKDIVVKTAKTTATNREYFDSRFQASVMMGKVHNTTLPIPLSRRTLICTSLMWG